MQVLCLAILALTVFNTTSRADAPLPRPATWILYSADKSVSVVLDANTWTTTAWKGEQQLWQMEGWFRSPAITNDGRHFVAGPDGLNLIGMDSDAQTVILSFYRDGALFATVPLGDLIDLDSLQQTVSHVYWGHFAGIDAQGLAVVETVESMRLSFDPETGRLIEHAPIQPDLPQ